MKSPWALSGEKATECALIQMPKYTYNLHMKSLTNMGVGSYLSVGFPILEQGTIGNAELFPTCTTVHCKMVNWWSIVKRHKGAGDLTPQPATPSPLAHALNTMPSGE